jgi:predicted nucleic acid-binding protein
LKKYVLDSNIYITAARDSEFAAELIQFSQRFLPQLYLHAVVVQELYVGAVNRRVRRFLDRNIVEPFETRGRTIVPSYGVWRRSGEVIAALVENGTLTAGGVPRSFVNDVLIGTSCHEGGAVVITLNERDFVRINEVERVPFVAPWPSR